MSNIMMVLPYSERMILLTEIHKALNKMLFKGKLKPIRMDICNIHDSNIDGELNAVYRKNLNPISKELNRHILIDMEYAIDILPTAGNPTNQMLSLMEIILHEMIHQYCDEHGIDDKNHCGVWAEVARKHGLDVEIFDEGNDFVEGLDPELSEEFEALSRELLLAFHISR